uniref:BTB domain-containing protein n=1 Tax=Macrostomum lignano TaxID=282301 RepID=A0A1I8HK06_9PLAT
SCDEIDEAIATPRQFHLARNCLLFPKCKSDLNAICHLFNCHQVKVRGNPDDDPADGEVNDKFGRFLEFVLRHRSVLSNSDHLRRLTIWHAAVAKQIDGQLSMEEFEAWRVEDFLKRYPDCKAMHDNAQVAWNCLHPNALMLNFNNPLHLKRPLRRALFTELSPLIDTAKPLLCDQNEFLIAAAGLALTETSRIGCQLCQLTSFDHLSAMFASHTANRDLQIDWGLLETAVFREVLADKCFKSARLTDAEQRFVRRRQQQDTAYARRLADFCRLALSYAHRCLAEENCSIGDASLAEFLNSAASDGAIPIRSSWPPLPGINSQASGESLSSSTMSLRRQMHRQPGGSSSCCQKTLDSRLELAAPDLPSTRLRNLIECVNFCGRSAEEPARRPPDRPRGRLCD